MTFRCLLFYSFNRLIVEVLATIGKRSLPNTIAEADLDYYEAAKQGWKVYVTAQLSHDEVWGPFEVGDNKTYSGFYNAPLNPDRKYNIWFGAYSEIDGVKYSL